MVRGSSKPTAGSRRVTPQRQRPHARQNGKARQGCPFPPLPPVGLFTYSAKCPLHKPEALARWLLHTHMHKKRQWPLSTTQEPHRAADSGLSLPTLPRNFILPPPPIAVSVQPEPAREFPLGKRRKQLRCANTGLLPVLGRGEKCCSDFERNKTNRKAHGHGTSHSRHWWESLWEDKRLDRDAHQTPAPTKPGKARHQHPEVGPNPAQGAKQASGRGRQGCSSLA